jgi:hypothetical protein
MCTLKPDGMSRPRIAHVISPVLPAAPDARQVRSSRASGNGTGTGPEASPLASWAILKRDSSSATRHCCWRLCKRGRSASGRDHTGASAKTIGHRLGSSNRPGRATDDLLTPKPADSTAAPESATTHVVVSGDAQPDPSIHPNNGTRAHPPDAHSDGMGAQKRAAGGREPGRYEIGVRGPIGPTVMQAFPMLAASDADLPVVGLEDAHRGDRLRLEADASRRGRQTPPSQARKRSERDGRLHTPRGVARVSFDPSLAGCSVLKESLDGRCGGDGGGLACRP